MISITFKDVGQGDSILLAWTVLGTEHIGIIDCNVKDGPNPILDEIRSRKTQYIDFIILSHLHYDHLSGMPELFEYCLNNKIQIGKFYHTFETQYLKIFSEILVSQNSQKVGSRFFTLFRELCKLDVIVEVERATVGLRPITLTSGFQLEFLSPIGKDHMLFTEQQAKFLHGKTTTLPDFNFLSTITKVTNKKNAAILTADTTIKQLRRLTGKILETVSHIQVPHHGSQNNHWPKLWNSLNKKLPCKAIFSVGDEKRDKLPKRVVVEYFDSNGYQVESTDCVYGISEHFGVVQFTMSSIAKANRTALSSFSRLTKPAITRTPVIPPTLKGDRSYTMS